MVSKLDKLKHFWDARYRVVNIGNIGLELNIDNIHEFQYYKNDSVLDIAVLKKIIRDGDTVIDAGANIGYITAHMLGMGVKNIYSCEPVSSLYNRLKKIERQDNRLIALNFAIGDVDKEIEIFLSKTHNQGNSLNEQWLAKWPDVFGKNVKKEKIKLKTLDWFIDKKIDFMKVDIEGSEEKMFIGGEAFFNKQKPIMQIEIYDHVFENVYKIATKYYKYIKRIDVRDDGQVYLYDYDSKKGGNPPTYLLYNDKDLERLDNFNFSDDDLSEVYDYDYLGDRALKLILNRYEFDTVLDIGCGAGIQSDIFLNAGKRVTCIDYGESVYFKENSHRITTIIGDFNTYNFSEKYDCIWCCHVLEHQLNPHNFLKKINKILKEEGVLAITVPPLKHEIVGGHVSLWNAGLLLYHLVLAGFDCSEAQVLRYGYNISVVLKKKSVNVFSKITFDAGDIRAISEYLPRGLEFSDTGVDTPFNGDINRVNWTD